MITHLIGQLKVAKPSQYTPKTTGVTQYYTEITVATESTDKDGELDLGVEKIQVPVNDLELLKKNIGKFIAIPYVTMNAKSGTYTFPNENMSYQLFDSDPLKVSFKPKL